MATIVAIGSLVCGRKLRPVNMGTKLKKWARRVLFIAAGGLIVLVIAFLVYFPGRQTPMAITLATGIGVSSLQAEVDALQAKAASGEHFSETDKRFLKNLYQCFAKGGRLTIVLRQSGTMMERYLSCSGETLQTQPRIFLGSRRVQQEMNQLRQKILTDQQAAKVQDSYTSPEFYMGDPDFFESFVGLYYGKISVRPSVSPDGTLTLQWRADLPWKWPSYHTPAGEHDPHAKFPLPNARSLLQGSRYCLRMDDGLGQQLEELGLAKPFQVYSVWQERLLVTQPPTR